jgi:hypothetical protein
MRWERTRTRSFGPLVFGWDRSRVRPVEVWLRGPRAGQPDISAERKRARGGPRRHAGVVTETTSTPAGALCHAPQSRISMRPFAVPVGSGVSLRAAIGGHRLRRRPWQVGRDLAVRRCAPGWTRSRRRDAPPQWRCSRDQSRLVALPVERCRRLEARPADHRLARFINSEIALLCGWQGAATRGDLLVGSGGTHQEIARLLEGGLVRPRAAPPAARGPRTARSLLGRSPCGS